MGSEVIEKIVAMKPNETLTSDKLKATGIQPEGVQKDGETPVPQKPSFLFLVSTVIGVATIIIVSISAYQGLTH